ncbi:hypothetical protein AVEN_181009-1 [Araneus ventricosus]|uniref:Uncharacterized protein n=1 Tax=Araneus ventricosus TaxID=182803 RepID=A0A4Y2I0Z9_ARAVE|nr:hypothetical protein AVEN_29751-1 [Araneus ventricosus]GBM70859.1 hypothetical protein AVEN_75957-1 [Araneus ventricosus]GBM70878.1 hypothetical protein AVEN_139919-1 [Araneus ventricosus]GBM70911.1 hypothetical protein AVEN_181009-1 [Araneus ventricosus]
MWNRTQELPPVYPESNNLGNKECRDNSLCCFKSRNTNSSTRNVLNIITCNISSNDGHPLWGSPAPKREMPGAIEPVLGLNNVITFYLLLCAGIGNTWTSRSQRELLDSYPLDSLITFLTSL